MKTVNNEVMYNAENGTYTITETTVEEKVITVDEDDLVEAMRRWIMFASDYEVEDVVTEEWKPVPVEAYSTRYWVSNTGKIKNIDGLILKQLKTDNHKGYATVTLNITNKGEKKPRPVLVHQMVAKAYLADDMRPDRTDVDHINRDITDNRVTNLRWCTHQENLINRTRVGRKRNEKTE